MESAQRTGHGAVSLRPAPASLAVLMVFITDVRKELSGDDVMLGLYLTTGKRPRRHALTQRLHVLVKQGALTRVSHGKFSLTIEGRRLAAGYTVAEQRG